MKNFIVFTLCLVAAVNAGDHKEVIAKIMEEVKSVTSRCATENNAPPEALKEMMAHQVPSSHEGKCMVFCLHQHFKIQKADGSIDRDGAMALLNEFKDTELHDAVLKVFLTCDAKIIIDADPCITAANIAGCALEEFKTAGISQEFAFE